jgi:hypothetical protein
MPKQHHNPMKKKYLPKGVGKMQVAISNVQRSLIQTQGGGEHRKELRRQAQETVKGGG